MCAAVEMQKQGWRRIEEPDVGVSDTGQQPSSALTAPSSAFHPLGSAGLSLPSEKGGIHLLYQFCPPCSTPLANPTLQTTAAVFLDIQFNISNNIGADSFRV